MLAAAAFAGIFIRPKPVGYARFLDILAFVLVAASAVVIYAHVWELLGVLHSDNPYEQYAFLHGRFAGPITDLIHFVHPAFPSVPWARYWWAYYFGFAAYLAPQLFWISVFRRHSLLTFAVAVTAGFSIWWERLIVLLAEFSRGS